jgi:hypothetical protein
MPIPWLAHRAPFRLAVLLAVAFTAFTACSSDDSNAPAPVPGSALRASWNVTSFATAADDFIAQGMVLVITFKSDGTYALTVTNDLVGICNPGPNCVEGGDYTATATTVTLDPGTVDEVVFDYTIAGTTLTMNGDIGGTPVTITATKT